MQYFKTHAKVVSFLSIEATFFGVQFLWHSFHIIPGGIYGILFFFRNYSVR